MKYLKVIIALFFGLDALPSTGDTIGAVIGLLFFMLDLTTI